jgi:selenocysteine-specific elongation factor
MQERDLVIGTAGHIDHGKTSLVRLLTGVDTDRLPAEKLRGITIDIGFASLDLGGWHVAIVDVPGHERFIPNMLAGATGIDLAMLVVAADDSVMPQTREHLEILRFLGLSGGVIALTKCDLADESWLTLVEDDVRSLTTGTFLESAPIIRTSATTRMGAEALCQAIRDVSETAPKRDDLGLFRLAIDRSFTVAGHGAVVTGSVASGSVQVGDELVLLPEGKPVRIRGLHRHERPVERIGRGARAALNLVGVHHSEIKRGQELAEPGYLEPSRVLSVEIRCGDDAPRSIRHRARYRLHLGTAEVAATLALLEANELRQGETTLAQLLLAVPIVAVHGQPFVLREESPPATLAGGRILQPVARRIRRRDHDARDRLDRLRSPLPTIRLIAALGARGFQPWTERELSRDTGIPLRDVSAAVAELAESGALVEIPVAARKTIHIVTEAAQALEDRVLRALARLHESKPRQTMIPRAHVTASLPDLVSETMISGVIERLKQRGLVIGDTKAVALKEHQPRLSQGERKLKAELLEWIRSGGFSPPEVEELHVLAGSRASAVPELLMLLCDEERLVEINPRLYLDEAATVELRRRVVAKLNDEGSLTMADLRDLLATTRKYAVPIGEYLDRTGLTVRDGDTRRLGPISSKSTA